MSRVRDAFINFINTQTQNIRAEFGIVVSENENGTYNVDPLSGDTIINEVRTYESALGFIKPVIGSVVTVQFYDNQTSYITNIIDYDVFTLLTDTENTIASKNQMRIVGRNVDLISISDDTKDINEENILEIKKGLFQGATQSGSINILATDELTSLSTKVANYGAPIGKTPSGKFVFKRTDEEGGALLSGKKVLLNGADNVGIVIDDGVNPSKTQMRLTDSQIGMITDKVLLQKTTTSNNVDLYGLLKDISNALTIIDTTIQTLAPNPALTTIVQTIKTKTDLL